MARAPIIGPIWALGEALHPDVYLFWTGDGVVISRITRRAAESYRAVVKHRLLLWDKYPVNDAWHAPHRTRHRPCPRPLRVVDGYRQPHVRGE